MTQRTPEEIQRLLEEQRANSKLHSLGDSQIKRTQSIRDITTAEEWRENHSAAMKNRNNEWRENVRQANKTKKVRRRTDAFYASREKLKADPEYQRMMAERNREMAQDPAWKAALQESRKGMKDANSAWRKNMKKANQERAKKVKVEGSAERAKFMEGRQRMQADPNWRKNVIRAKGKPFVTPIGVFDTLNSAGDAYNIERNFRNGKKWVFEQLKRGTEGFYHISWEEYDRLMESQ